ncbi:MAG: peptidoglycan DD-metalloendopeptidase family protein [Dysgonamonadaceae bacterium]|jgi:murein DD-endopeptidase MepM/ murein hydrolase activator NlpD|nr:peptidoglycan DD-metalloendopeptidase family protein [Dysgonamonadaceae bacterium]
MKSNRIVLIIAVIIVIFFVIIIFFTKNKSQVPEEEPVVDVPEPLMEYGLIPDSLLVEKSEIKRNDVLSRLLVSLGATANDVAEVAKIRPEVFDMRNLKAGNSYKAYYTAVDDSTRKLSYWVYEKSPYDYSIFCFQDTFYVLNGRKEIDLRKKVSSARINTSLWNAAVENDIDVNVALQLSDIYAWTIDFFGLRQGDRFTVLYDEIYVDSTLVGVGEIYAALFTHNNKEFAAFGFVQDSIPGYWDAEGNNLKKEFLKAPLTYSRISSHFSYARKHPVLRTVRPHTGVDYAAPAGTPVVSIGQGVVVEKGYNGGGGNTVKIRHNSVYTTAYLHLSRFAKGLKVGQHVRQGQLIGYVGSTGLSTGPHLDFRVWKNNKPVNPLKIESPPREPVKADNKAAFDSLRLVYTQLLDSIRTNP